MPTDKPARSRAEVTTERPGRYRKQLVSHLGRKLATSEIDGGSRVEFDRGYCDLIDETGMLLLRAFADDAGVLAQVEDVVGRHLVKFGSRDELVVTWRAEHPITLTPTEREVTAVVQGQTIAKTTRAIELAEADYPVVVYVPIDDVDAGALRESDTVTTCPFKGQASYYHVITEDGVETRDALWRYGQPHPGVADIANYVAFDPKTVTVAG